jgi:hypothetical protein
MKIVDLKSNKMYHFISCIRTAKTLAFPEEEFCPEDQKTRVES